MLYLKVDFSDLNNLEKTLGPAIEKATKEAARDLSAMTYEHLRENVQSKLHTTTEKYLNSLSIYQDGDVWIINLDAKARWIEDGMEAHSMVEDLLKSKSAKTSKKDGSRYVVIPFQHNVGASKQTPQATDLTNAIKAHMKQQKIPYGKLEKDEQGNVKSGLLHKFNLDKPLKTKQGVGQGSGPIGSPKQGTTGTPFLHGVSVHQYPIPTTGGGVGWKKFIMTFRVASSKHIGTNKWIHPGLTPGYFFEEAYDWALNLLEKEIKPKVIQSILDSTK